MSMIDWLRKLGVFRFGVEGGVYRSAKDRPLSLQEDGVFNSEKDVIRTGPKVSRDTKSEAPASQGM